MKLYHMTGACSLSPHITLRELGLPFDLIKVDRDKKTSDGKNFLEINPKGYVPAIEMDNGHVLTEGPAIVQYLGDRKPESGMMPKAGDEARYHVQEWLTFIGTEIHKNFSPLFRKAGGDWEKAARENLHKRLSWTGEKLQGRQFLMGDKISVADPYLFVMTLWGKKFELDLKALKLQEFADRMHARPAVQEALKAEGLV